MIDSEFTERWLPIENRLRAVEEAYRLERIGKGDLARGQCEGRRRASNPFDCLPGEDGGFC